MTRVKETFSIGADDDWLVYAHRSRKHLRLVQGRVPPSLASIFKPFGRHDKQSFVRVDKELILIMQRLAPLVSRAGTRTQTAARRQLGTSTGNKLPFSVEPLFDEQVVATTKQKRTSRQRLALTSDVLTVAAALLITTSVIKEVSRGKPNGGGGDRKRRAVPNNTASDAVTTSDHQAN